MDSELLTCLLKFIDYFPDYLSALSRTLLRFFGQPLSKQLYAKRKHSAVLPCTFCYPVQGTLTFKSVDEMLKYDHSNEAMEGQFPMVKFIL